MPVRALSVLGRTLLRLAQSQSTGTLKLREAGASLELRFEQGRVVGLGERRKRARASEELASRSYKTRRGLIARCARFAARPLANAQFLSHQHPRHKMDLDEPFDALDLTLAMSRGLPFFADLSTLLEANWVLSKHGQQLTKAALAPAEAAIVGAFAHLPQKRGLRGARLVGAVPGHNVLRTLGTWVEVGLVERFQHPGSCGLLLRRRLELRKRGEFSTPASRRTFRRRAAELHPDRFDPALETTSRDVMLALLKAGDRIL